MRELIEEYGQAAAARACAVQVCIGTMPPGQKAPLLLAAEAREAKAREALEDAIATAAAHMGEITGLADEVRLDRPIIRATDPTIAANGWEADWSRVGVDRYRKQTLKDAKRNAELIAKRARQAWDILDPSLSSTHGVQAAPAKLCKHCEMTGDTCDGKCGNAGVTVVTRKRHPNCVNPDCNCVMRCAAEPSARGVALPDGSQR